MRPALKYLLFFFLMATIFSCHRDEGPAPDLGYGYFPDAVGKYVIYDVDSFVQDDPAGIDTVYKMQVKEMVESIYNDNQNRPTMRIERYKKFYNPSVPYSAMNWTFKDVWSANVTKTTAEKVEEGVRFVKLIFPVKESATWNGNAQNTLGQQDYKYIDVDMFTTVGASSFDSTLTVLQTDKENLIEKQYYQEMYARNTWMIYKKIIDVKSKTITGANIMNRITSGLICTMVYNSSGYQ